MKLKKSKLGEFVPVLENGNIHYGGHQDNLKYRGVSKFYRDRSCVVTAFTNVYLYLYKPKEKYSIEEFNDYQYWFYKTFRPKIYGIPSAKILDLKVNKLRRAYHLNLKAHFLNDSLICRKNIGKVASFIKDGLEKDLPIIFFNWAGRKVDIMTHHGVVITEIEDKKEDYLITVSSWGRRYVLSLKEFAKQFRTYTGFIYYERLDG
ncbi:MAG: hypothetical protein PUG67_07565 [Peptoniphilaceae bacterium]|nr:hypothetical protein [Peptoniphilaceae bacterium]MDY6018233.1 hypothetical protein [Anaerococcus sp.]